MSKECIHFFGPLCIFPSAFSHIQRQACSNYSCVSSWEQYRNLLIKQPRSRGQIPGAGRQFLFPRSSDRLWGTPNLLLNVCRRLYSQDYSGRGMKLTTLMHLVPRLRVSGAVVQTLSHRHSWNMKGHLTFIRTTRTWIRNHQRDNEARSVQIFRLYGELVPGKYQKADMVKIRKHVSEFCNLLFNPYRTNVENRVSS